MAIFTQENNKCYFIHIPRTGGRYISSLFEHNGDIKCEYHRIHKQRFGDIDATHLHYPLYNLFLEVSDIPHIAVVRNPYNKFSSCIRNMNQLHGIDYNSVLDSYDNFFNFVTTEITDRSYHNNWFLPQHQFMSPKTHYWKYEWGFGKKFKNWIYDKTKIKIKINLNNIVYEKIPGEIQERYNYKLNENIKNYVKKYYKEDYKKFKYFW